VRVEIENALIALNRPGRRWKLLLSESASFQQQALAAEEAKLAVGAPRDRRKSRARQDT
jgi:hypothetical protein